MVGGGAVVCGPKQRAGCAASLGRRSDRVARPRSAAAAPRAVRAGAGGYLSGARGGGWQEGKQYAGRFLGLEGLFAQVAAVRACSCVRA